MSAIWGAVNLSGETLSHNYKNIFIQEYERKTQLDSTKLVEIPSAIVGRGLQLICDEDKYDRLPIENEEKSVILTADCVLDNRNELIEMLLEEAKCGEYSKKLLDGQFSDGELLYLLYERYENQVVELIRGCFAIAIYKYDKKELVLISDHVASRALYYTRIGDVVLFSTIMSPLSMSMDKAKLNINYAKDFLLSDYSTIYTVPGETHVKEIEVMRPARLVRFTLPKKNEQIYWSAKQARIELDNTTPQGILNKFMECYRQSVKAATRSIGEIGITLSGGLDSSSVAALASEILENRALYSYTSVPAIKGESSSKTRVTDESGLVKDIVKMYPNIRPEFLCNEGKNDFEDINLILDIFEMPYKTAPFASHLEILEKARADGCRVVLVGEYGNTSVSFGELENILYNFYVKQDSASLLKYASNFCEHEGLDTTKYIMKNLSAFKSYEAFLQSKKSRFENFYPDNCWISSSILSDYNLEERMTKNKRNILSKSYMSEGEYSDYLFDESLQIYLGILKTKFGLYTGTLLRDPTMDVRMLEFCNSIPFEYFAYNGINRFLIREGFKELLPASIIKPWRQKGIQSSDWMAKLLRDWEVLKPWLINHLESITDENIFVNEMISYVRGLEKDSNNEELSANKRQLSSIFAIISLTILIDLFILAE